MPLRRSSRSYYWADWYELLEKHDDPNICSAKLHISWRHDSLPSLDSIVATEGCSFIYLMFPKAWRDYRSRSNVVRVRVAPVYHEIQWHAGKHNWLWYIQSKYFFQADTRLISTDIGSYSFGVQFSTCYACLKHYCSRYYCCDKFVRFCQNCEKGILFRLLAKWTLVRSAVGVIVLISFFRKLLSICKPFVNCGRSFKINSTKVLMSGGKICVATELILGRILCSVPHAIISLLQKTWRVRVASNVIK